MVCLQGVVELGSIVCRVAFLASATVSGVLLALALQSWLVAHSLLGPSASHPGAPLLVSLSSLYNSLEELFGGVWWRQRFAAGSILLHAAVI